MDNPVQYPLEKGIGYSKLSPSVHWAQYHRREPSMNWSRRIYDFELLYVKEGEIAACLGERQFRVIAGELLYIPSGVYHRITILSQPDAAFLGIHFDYSDELEIEKDEHIIVTESCVELLKFCHEPRGEHFEPLSSSPVIIPPPPTVSLLEKVIEEFTHRDPGYEAACKSLILQILLQIWRSQAEKKKAPHPKYGEQMLKLASLIENRFREKWSYNDLARMANLHEDYVARLFKNAVGMPPNKYLQTIRHREAKRLLRETDKPVEPSARKSVTTTRTISAGSSNCVKECRRWRTGIYPEYCRS